MLDIATGEGGYIPLLQRYLKSYQSIIGVDTNPKVLQVARVSHKAPGIQFMQMNAENLAFDNGSIDLVNISASLHHLENVARVLAEMKRVLKSGGTFILTEMHRDGSSTEQFNAIRIHHWAAAVDSSLGLIHDRTFSRQEILNFVDAMNLRILATRDFSDHSSNPRDAKAVSGIQDYMDRYHLLLDEQADNQFLIEQEKELRATLAEKGFQREPVILVLAEKP